LSEGGAAVSPTVTGWDEAGVECWCCGNQLPEASMVRLGSHPEAAVCLSCAHFVHKEARAREDAARPSSIGRLRDVLRSGRHLVVDHGWHRLPVVGPGLRWLGRFLP